MGVQLQDGDSFEVPLFSLHHLALCLIFFFNEHGTSPETLSIEFTTAFKASGSFVNTWKLCKLHSAQGVNK